MSKSLSAVSTPTISSSSPDQRNLQWKSSNIGAKLLEKMGWKDGQAVGKGQRTAGQSTGDGEGSSFSSEGLRIRKRVEGMGVGADKSMSAQVPGASDVHKEFTSVLAALGQHSPEPGKGSRGSRKEKKSLSLPKNKTTCHKVRRAKFQEKTAEDMKCIFGSSSIDFPVVASSGDPSANSGGGKKEAKKEKKKRKSKDDEEQKRNKKKSKR